MKFLISTSIITLSLIGIIGIQNVDARCFDDKYCFPNNLRIADLDGNSIGTVITDNQYILKSSYPMKSDLLCYFGINVPLSLCPDHEFPLVIGDKVIERPPEIDYVYIIQIKDEQGAVSDLKWTSGIATDTPTNIEISWIPKKSGTYMIENFIWSSFDNPVIITIPNSLSVIIENKASKLENKSNIINGCKNVEGIWIDEFNECESSSVTESFESYCDDVSGTYSSCHSGCRNSPNWSDGICTTKCFAVCQFE